MVLLEKTGASDKEVVAAFASVRATGELTARSAWWVGNTLRSIQRREFKHPDLSTSSEGIRT